MLGIVGCHFVIFWPRACSAYNTLTLSLARSQEAVLRGIHPECLQMWLPKRYHLPASSDVVFCLHIRNNIHIRVAVTTNTSRSLTPYVLTDSSRQQWL